MGSNVKWIAILVIAQFSVVLCRNSFYEYYYSRFHHKRSTTEALSSSISDISSEENTRPSVSGSTAEALSSSVPGDIVIGNILHGAAGNAILQNILNSGKGDQAVEVDRNITNILYGGTYGAQDQRDAGTIASLVFVPIVIGLVLCCCYCGRRYRKEYKGILCNQDPGATRLPTEQNTFNYQQFPNYTDGLEQQHATHYQSPPAQQHATHYQPPPAQQHATHYQPPQVQQHATNYQSPQVQQPPYFPAVHSFYHNNPTSQMQYPTPDAPPPPYDVPSFGAPPYENPLENKEK